MRSTVWLGSGGSRLAVLTMDWCWLESASELTGGRNSSCGEMGLRARKPPLVLEWDRGGGFSGQMD